MDGSLALEVGNLKDAEWEQEEQLKVDNAREAVDQSVENQEAGQATAGEKPGRRPNCIMQNNGGLITNVTSQGSICQKFPLFNDRLNPPVAWLRRSTREYTSRKAAKQPAARPGCSHLFTK